MYCNSCMGNIAKDDVTYCEQCHVPLHKKCANHCMICGKTLCDTCYADNHYKCEECFTPNETFQVIRRSHIEQYAGCPYSLYLQLVMNITPPMGKHAQVGVITHEIIDLLSHHDLDIAEAHRMLDEKIDEWNLSTDDDYSIISIDLNEIGHKCIGVFSMIGERFNNYDEFKSEYNIKYSLDDNLPMISCTLDRINFKGEDIHIHDWKTGKAMAGQKLITDLQPPLYIYAVYKEFGKMPKSFTLHYLQTNKSINYKYIGNNKYEVTTTKNTYILDVDEAIERTKEILKNIKDNKFQMPDEKTSKWRCNNMCWFGLSGKCAGSQDEQWKALNKKYRENKK